MNQYRMGTVAFVSKNIFNPMGWDIHLRKYDGTKILRPVLSSIEWVECSEYEVTREAIQVSAINDDNQISQQSALNGENKALKDEITFLRAELAKALAR